GGGFLVACLDPQPGPAKFKQQACGVFDAVTGGDLHELAVGVADPAEYFGEDAVFIDLTVNLARGEGKRAGVVVAGRIAAMRVHREIEERYRMPMCLTKDGVLALHQGCNVVANLPRRLVEHADLLRFGLDCAAQRGERISEESE